MGDTPDRHHHYDDNGNSIYLSGLKKNNQQHKTKYQDMMERYYRALKWKNEPSKH